MQTRTAETTVTFRRPFALKSVGATLPPGSYRIVTDETEILGLSFLAFERSATMLHTPAISAAIGARQVFTIDPADLAAAQDADAAD